MPLLIGLAVGFGIRFCRADGTFSLASFAVVLVLLSGFVGSAFQLKIMFEHRLKIMAEAAFDETLGYAKHTVPAEADDEALRRFMANNEVSVIGRLTPVDGQRHRYNYWEARNFIHLHWIASRNIILYDQGGADKTIWEASRVLKEYVFLDDVVSGLRPTPTSIRPKVEKCNLCPCLIVLPMSLPRAHPAPLLLWRRRGRKPGRRVPAKIIITRHAKHINLTYRNC